MPKCKICKNVVSTESVILTNMPGKAQYLPDSSSLKDDSALCLELYACPYCSVIFLDTEPVSYYREVIRSASVSEELKAQKQKQFNEFCEKYALKEKNVVEIGCGNGEFLEILAKCTPQAFGLEYAIESVSKCQSKGLNIYQGFISSDDYRICDDLFDGFLLLMFLEHIPEPRTFLRGIFNNLTNDAVGIIEVPNSEMIFGTGLYAEIMKDHLFYFNLQSVSVLLGSCGFEIIEQNIIRDDYVLSLTVRKKSTYALNDITDYIKKVNNCFSNSLDKHKKVAIWGASHQTFFLLSQLIDTTKISCIIDSAEFKQGKFSPVTHIPIIKPSDELEDFDAIIVSAGSYSPEIIEILRLRYNYPGSLYIFNTDTLKRV